MTRQVNHYSGFFALLFTALLLGGCTVVPKPQGLEQQLAYAYGTHTAVLTAAANAVEVGTLSPADGQQVLRLADESRTLLDASRAAIGVGDLTTAEGQLSLATNILQQLNVYLNARATRTPR